MKVLVTIFNPAEFYPPTINAVEYLSEKYKSIELVTHSIDATNQWTFPENVRVTYAGKWQTDMAISGHIKNITRFLNYVRIFWKRLKNNQYDVILLYEPYAALAYMLSSFFVGKRKALLWYHNHDILEPGGQGKISIGRFASKAEHSIFNKLSIFSLPSNERKEYFSMDKLKGNYFFIPNYPSKKFYSKFYTKKTPGSNLRIIYQGRIGEGHGLEEIISLLKEPLNGKQLTLCLKGIIEKNYKDALIALAEKHNVAGQVFFYGLTSYKEVPLLASTCDVGIAIHTKTDVMNKTLGTSSNKIYEYAGLGLPVLLYDNTHFKEHLGKYKWALFTDCSKQSLQQSLLEIINRYEELSSAAFTDFITELNFESYIEPLINYIEEKRTPTKGK